ncbi:hypothetical protein KUTeg_014375 [Tegillarca granosa]|uniref:Uncharacterized protein n=1 Tax=Tegillarca granosa TaxID=220873 RepID=A0ABQ9EWD7_TEGGR|nr:hypothetical protein KUTeg_014375 [Tegillarca granosa]
MYIRHIGVCEHLQLLKYDLKSTMSTALVASSAGAALMLHDARHGLLEVAVMNNLLHKKKRGGHENMEISPCPHKTVDGFGHQNHAENHQMIKQKTFTTKSECKSEQKQQGERHVLKDIQNNISAGERSFMLTGSKSKKSEKSKIPDGKKARKVSGSKKHHKFHVMRPQPSAIMDDDLLPMDIDFDISTKIRDVLIKAPDVVHMNPRLAEYYSCPEYADDIYQYLQTVERRVTFPENYLSSNPEITPHMRAILTDWLIQVQNCQQQTLHLTVALIDRYLNARKLSLATLQLLGISCLFIAAKYADRFPPEVILMECIILKEIQFDLNILDPSGFLDRFLQIEEDMHDHKEMENLCMYLLDLTLTSHAFVHYVPSVIAASSVYLGRKLLQFDECWTAGLAYYTRYSEKELVKCSQLIAKHLMKVPTSKYQVGIDETYIGAKTKYGSASSYGGISFHPSVSDISLLKAAAGEETLIM